MRTLRSVHRALAVGCVLAGLAAIGPVYASSASAQATTSSASAQTTTVPASAQAPARASAPASAQACKLRSGPDLPPDYVGVGFPRPSVRMDTKGVVRIAILFVDFPGSARTAKTPDALWKTLEPAQAFFRTVSYQQMKAELVPHLTWIRMSRPAAAYNIRNDGSLTFDTLRAYMQEAVTKADPKVDFSRIDGVVVASTPTATAIPYSPAFVASSTSAGLATREGSIANGSIAATDVWVEGGWGWRILPHELGHAMGLADLYDGWGENPHGLHGYVGIWDLMGDPASPTPEYNAWNRWLLGWLSDRQIVCGSKDKAVTATLTAIGDRGGTKAVVIPVGATRAVVVESRRPTTYDAAEYLGSPIQAGALVYVVDTSVITLRGPIRVVPDDRGDAFYNLASAPLGPGNSVTTQGLRISVVSSAGRTDTVRVQPAR